MLRDQAYSAPFVGAWGMSEARCFPHPVGDIFRAIRLCGEECRGGAPHRFWSTVTGSWRWTPASDPADFWLGWNSSAPQVFPFSMTAWQLTTGPERQFTCGPRVPWKERLRRVCEGTPPGFSFLLLFFPFFVRALILSPLSRVMGNVYVFSRIKDISSGAFWFVFSRT